MDLFLNILKSVLYGIVQGITEWLPISSTGHLILMRTFMPLNVYMDAVSNQNFWDMYKVVIQFGSILAVLLLYFKKLNPFNPRLKPARKRSIYRLWIMIIIACVPAGIAGILLDDLIDCNYSHSLWYSLHCDGKQGTSIYSRNSKRYQTKDSIWGWYVPDACFDSWYI